MATRNNEQIILFAHLCVKSDILRMNTRRAQSTCYKDFVKNNRL